MFGVRCSVFVDVRRCSLFGVRCSVFGVRSAFGVRRCSALFGVRRCSAFGDVRRCSAMFGDVRRSAFVVWLGVVVVVSSACRRCVLLLCYFVARLPLGLQLSPSRCSVSVSVSVVVRTSPSLCYGCCCASMFCLSTRSLDGLRRSRDYVRRCNDVRLMVRCAAQSLTNFLRNVNGEQENSRIWQSVENAMNGGAWRLVSAQVGTGDAFVRQHHPTTMAGTAT